MIFQLEDNKKWTQLLHMLKACLGSSQRVMFLWSSTEGWLLMQNGQNLENLDCEHQVVLCRLGISFFSQTRFTSGIERASFEVDLSKIFLSLRSTRKTTRRVVFSLSEHMQELQDTKEMNFTIHVFDEDGVVEMIKRVQLIKTLNQSLYFGHMKSLSWRDSEQWLSVPPNSLKGVREFRDCVLQLKYKEEGITLESLHNEQDLFLQISRPACGNYDYSRVAELCGEKNKILIPPNFLALATVNAGKLQQPLSFQFGEEMLSGRITLYLKIKTETFEMVSAFAAVVESGDFDGEFDGKMMAAGDTQNHQQIHNHNNTEIFAGELRYTPNMRKEQALRNRKQITNHRDAQVFERMDEIQRNQLLLAKNPKNDRDQEFQEEKKMNNERSLKTVRITKDTQTFTPVDREQQLSKQTQQTSQFTQKRRLEKLRDMQQQQDEQQQQQEKQKSLDKEQKPYAYELLQLEDEEEQEQEKSRKQTDKMSRNVDDLTQKSANGNGQVRKMKKLGERIPSQNINPTTSLQSNDSNGIAGQIGELDKGVMSNFSKDQHSKTQNRNEYENRHNNNKDRFEDHSSRVSMSQSQNNISHNNHNHKKSTAGMNLLDFQDQSRFLQPILSPSTSKKISKLLQKNQEHIDMLKQESRAANFNRDSRTESMQSNNYQPGTFKSPLPKRKSYFQQGESSQMQSSQKVYQFSDSPSSQKINFYNPHQSSVKDYSTTLKKNRNDRMNSLIMNSASSLNSSSNQGSNYSNASNLINSFQNPLLTNPNSSNESSSFFLIPKTKRSAMSFVPSKAQQQQEQLELEQQQLKQQQQQYAAQQKQQRMLEVQQQFQQSEQRQQQHQQQQQQQEGDSEEQKHFLRTPRERGKGDNSFDNFLRQNKRNEDFSIFSVSKGTPRFFADSESKQEQIQFLSSSNHNKFKRFEQQQRDRTAMKPPVSLFI